MLPSSPSPSTLILIPSPLPPSSQQPNLQVFTFKTEKFEGSVGFAVIETTDDEVIMSRQEALLAALNEDKDSKGLSLLYLAVVNIVKLRGTLFCLSANEVGLASASFPEGRMVGEWVMDLGNLVSRKKDYIPAITRAIKNGWAAAPRGKIRASKSDVFNFDKEAQ